MTTPRARRRARSSRRPMISRARASARARAHECLARARSLDEAQAEIHHVERRYARRAVYSDAKTKLSARREDIGEDAAACALRGESAPAPPSEMASNGGVERATARPAPARVVALEPLEGQRARAGRAQQRGPSAIGGSPARAAAARGEQRGRCGEVHRGREVGLELPLTAPRSAASTGWCSGHEKMSASRACSAVGAARASPRRRARPRAPRGRAGAVARARARVLGRARRRRRPRRPTRRPRRRPRRRVRATPPVTSSWFS